MARPGSTEGRTPSAPLAVLLLMAAMGLAGAQAAPAASDKPGQAMPLLQPTTFTELPGWPEDDHRAALAGFLRHCDKGLVRKGGVFGIEPEALRALCPGARRAWAAADPSAARRFFEDGFTPHRITAKGFVTGYFEPEYRGARTRSPAYPHPLLRRPPELVALTEANRPTWADKDWPFGLRAGDGTLRRPPDRGAIMDGALAGRGLELVWLADPVDAFYIHVQGSARIRLAEGGVMRVGYAGKTGHPYSPIGRVMIERGLAEPGTVTMAVLRGWLADNPGEVDAVLRRNRSYIFFREVREVSPEEGPVGAAGLPLIAGRSLAVDAGFHTYGAPVFVSADLPLAKGRGLRPFRRLMLAEDTGSAITGAARGDVFFGSGAAAGEKAGPIQHEAVMMVLIPRGAS